jgi:hypothetical protein
MQILGPDNFVLDALEYNILVENTNTIKGSFNHTFSVASVNKQLVHGIPVQIQHFTSVYCMHHIQDLFCIV